MNESKAVPLLLSDSCLQSSDLPILAHQEEIVAALRANQVLIVAGETGSGKTTQLPKMCLAAGRGKRKRIGCTQPRRIAALTVAERVAEELGEQSFLVGSKIRFKDSTSRDTRIKFMTDGILLAEAQHDRNFSAYDTLIVDEAHERSLNIDFLLGYLKQLLPKRPDLKVVITSATIDTARFAAFFGGAPVIEVSGRGWPVVVRYLPPDEDGEEEESFVDRAVAATLRLCREEGPGDVLVFMPTERDIIESQAGIAAGLARQGQAGVALPLFGRLAPGEQKKVFRPVKGRKIVVATNVAETSITVPGIRFVVDSGLARLPSYNPRARTSKLPVVRVSQAACDQRMGRCGRVGPGLCLRLYSEEDYQGRPRYTPPEILRTNLAAVILRMQSLGLGEPAAFPFLDPPSGRAIQDGYALLAELGATDRRGRLTARGRLMARLPLDPRISRMIIAAREENALREVMVIAAGLSIQDPRIRPPGKEEAAAAAHARFAGAASDFLFFLALWDTYHATFTKLKSLARMGKFCTGHYLSFVRMREWFDVYAQISQALAEEPGFVVNREPASPEAVHRAILSGNLRNIAMKKDKAELSSLAAKTNRMPFGGRNLYLAAGGREAAIFPGSCLSGKGPEWIMAAELIETTRLFARTVAPIRPEWLEAIAGELCRFTYSDPHWEKGRGQVVAWARVSLFGLVIVPRRKVNFGTIEPEETRRIFIRAALVEGELKGDYPFLAANLALVARLSEMEDRLRRPDIVVDEEDIFAFYESRLGPEVRDQRSLNQWLKTKGAAESLVLRENDLIRSRPENHELEKFPQTIAVSGIELPLAYRFAPGEADDGVTAQVPASLAPHLDQERFEWLVPGLLLEKLTFLLRGLPKSLRRSLVPIPDTAAALVRDLPFAGGSLYRALERQIAGSHRLRINQRDWPIDSLPGHLRFRFLLVDGQGKEVLATRDPAGLKSREAERETMLSTARLAGLKREWEKGAVGAAGLTPLPASLPVTGADGVVQGFVYPGLALAGAETEQRLFAGEAEARESTRQALAMLYLAEFAQQGKALRRELTIPRGQWPLYEGLAGHEQFNEELWRFMMSEVFLLHDGLVPEAGRFAATVAEVKNSGFPGKCREIFNEVVKLLQERRATLDLIAGLAGKPGGAARAAIYREQAVLIVPGDFLRAISKQRFPALLRYLKALRTRIERGRLYPGKEAEKAARVAVHEAHFTKAVAGEGNSLELADLLARYREMIEEYKVSLFAQELGTAYPVSEKRLAAKWAEIEALLP